MTERITLRLFLICLVCCASLVLSFIWGGEPDDVYIKIAVTLFVVGLASFLCWLVTMFYSLRRALAGSRLS